MIGIALAVFRDFHSRLFSGMVNHWSKSLRLLMQNGGLTIDEDDNQAGNTRLSTSLNDVDPPGLFADFVGRDAVKGSGLLIDPEGSETV